MRTEASTCAQEWTCAPGDRIDRLTELPDMTEPGDSMHSIAMPARPAEPCTVRAGGSGSCPV